MLILQFAGRRELRVHNLSTMPRQGDWDPIRAEHYGQRPNRPHKQAAHMTAPDQCWERLSFPKTSSGRIRAMRQATMVVKRERCGDCHALEGEYQRRRVVCVGVLGNDDRRRGDAHDRRGSRDARAPDKDLARQRCRDCREQIGVGGARVGAPILPQPAGRQRDARVRQSSQRCRA
jgi:hypothetical protein